jgi:hypothetical protein
MDCLETMAQMYEGRLVVKIRGQRSSNVQNLENFLVVKRSRETLGRD